MSEAQRTIWVCMDCMLHQANGECGECYDDVHNNDEEPLGYIDEGQWIAAGMSWDEHAEDCQNRIERKWLGECDCEKDTYSTSQCEGCGTYLHGERHAMTLFSL